MKIDVEKLHKLFKTDKTIASISTELGVPESEVHGAIAKLRKTEPKKWPKRKVGRGPAANVKPEKRKPPVPIEATYQLPPKDTTPANGPVITYTLTPEELAKYGPVKPYEGPEKKPITWNVQKLDKQNQEQTSAELVDNVNNPQHYTAGGIETIDYIRAKLSPEQFEGFMLGNVIKYCSRSKHKGGIEDLKKARWYLNKLIGEVAE